MTRTTLALLVAALLAVGALWFLRKQESADPLAEYPERQFAVANGADIERIAIVNLRGKRIELSRGPNNRWLINDSLRASPAIMQGVVSALTTLRVDHMPPKAAVPRIQEAIQTDGLKVSTFDKAGNTLSSFIIGPTTYDDANSYAVVDGYDEPFAVRVSGLSGTLRVMFNPNSVFDWRSREFMEFEPDSIASIEVAYPKQPGESFRVERAGADGEYTVTALTRLGGKPPGELAQTRAAAFVDEFADVPLDRRRIDPVVRDSVMQFVPHALINVAHRGDTTRYRVYPRYIRDDYGVVDPDQRVAVYFVDRDGEEFVSVQAKQIEGVLRGFTSFFQ